MDPRGSLASEPSPLCELQTSEKPSLERQSVWYLIKDTQGWPLISTCSHTCTPAYTILHVCTHRILEQIGFGMQLGRCGCTAHSLAYRGLRKREITGVLVMSFTAVGLNFQHHRKKGWRKERKRREEWRSRGWLLTHLLFSRASLLWENTFLLHKATSQQHCVKMTLEQVWTVHAFRWPETRHHLKSVAVGPKLPLCFQHNSLGEKEWSLCKDIIGRLF